jgi:hypothetical protein
MHSAALQQLYMAPSPAGPMTASQGTDAPAQCSRLMSIWRFIRFFVTKGRESACTGALFFNERGYVLRLRDVERVTEAVSATAAPARFAIARWAGGGIM